jgi:hypothetical protein
MLNVQVGATEEWRKFTRDVLVDDDPHASYADVSRRCSASSRAAMACARDMDG